MCASVINVQFSTALRKHVSNVINLKRKNATINKKELKLHQDATSCYICGKVFLKIQDFFLLQEDFDIFHEPFFEAFFCFPDNILLKRLYIGKKITRKMFN